MIAMYTDGFREFAAMRTTGVDGAVRFTFPDRSGSLVTWPGDIFLRCFWPLYSGETDDQTGEQGGETIRKQNGSRVLNIHLDIREVS